MVRKTVGVPCLGDTGKPGQVEPPRRKLVIASTIWSGAGFGGKVGSRGAAGTVTVFALGRVNFGMGTVPEAVAVLFGMALTGVEMNSSHLVFGVGPPVHTQSGRKPLLVALSQSSRYSLNLAAIIQGVASEIVNM